jgi:hypothetical protein
MRKLSRKELTAPIEQKHLLPIYEVVVSRYWAKDKKTFVVACHNEIEAARWFRENMNDVSAIHSITLRENAEVWA